MKYLKKFEQSYDNQLEITDLKNDDYVIVNCPDLNINNEILQLRDDPMYNNFNDEGSGFTIKAGKPGSDRFDNNTFFDHEIVRKLNTEEANFLLNVNKYNL